MSARERVRAQVQHERRARRRQRLPPDLESFAPLLQKPAPMRRFGGRHAFGEKARHIPEKEGVAIAIAFSVIGLALAALVFSLIAAKSDGIVRVTAQTLAIIFASLTGALAGFSIPLIPFADGVRDSALAAGILGTLGTIGGMALAEKLMARLDQRR
jgi:hypothetical protein